MVRHDSAMLSVRIYDSGDLRRVIRDLHRTAEGRELQRELTKTLRGLLSPLVQEIKASYAGGTHLRPALRRATHSWVRTRGNQAGAGVMVDGRRMPSGMKRLPQYWEGEGRWRHPLFGNRDHWYSQAPHPSFWRIVREHEFGYHREIESAGDNSFDPLRRGR